MGIEDATGVALDPQHGKVYWADPAAGRIGRADLDGGYPEQVWVGERSWGPTKIALDLHHKRVYWMDFYLERVYRVGLDGSDVEEVVHRTQRSPSSIALFWDR